MIESNIHSEWSYASDELGLVYCLGRNAGYGVSDAVATYYETSQEFATKQSVDSDAYYRRFIYQGLPEERERLALVERMDVVERLKSQTSLDGVGISVDRGTLMPSAPKYSEVSGWLQSEHPRAAFLKIALNIAGTALERAGVAIEDLSLYGGAAFGVVNASTKDVDDVDFVFTMQQRDKLNSVLSELKSEYTWDEIDPFGRLPTERQLLKAKRWSTSQVRLTFPYTFSIDLKVRRNLGEASLWDNLPNTTDTFHIDEILKVVDDNEALCISPALICEDSRGNERTVLFDGYQYIGCAVAGDEIRVSGSMYRDSGVIRVNQSNSNGVVPDFCNVPIV